MTTRTPLERLLAVLAAAMLLGPISAAGAAMVEDQPHGGKAEKGKKEKAPKSAFELPPNAMNPDGSVNQDVVLAVQKKHVETLNKKFAAKFAVAETPHYLIFSDSPAAVTQQFALCCEALYNNLQRQLALPAAERVWDGKCVLMLFKNKPEMQTYAKDFDEMEPGAMEGYCGGEWYGKKGEGTLLVHIVLFTGASDFKLLQRVFVHEATHGFFFGYRSRVVLPTWLNEGLAEYMTVVNDAGLHKEKWDESVKRARSGASIQQVFEVSGDDRLKAEDYAIAYSLTEVLVTGSKTKFKELVDALKDGKEPNNALTANFGVDTSGLEKQWRAYLTSSKGAAKRK
ncbi:MAG: peptidase MA family metallohydrolase [Planctomycetota bacterium]|nr:peptidase MA family metallohydrolase [Planctomycetota bacterium]